MSLSMKDVMRMTLPPGWAGLLDFDTDMTRLRAPSGREYWITRKDIEDWGWDKCLAGVLRREAEIADMCAKVAGGSAPPPALSEEYKQLTQRNISDNQYLSMFQRGQPMRIQRGSGADVVASLIAAKEEAPRWDGPRRLALADD